MNPVISPKRRAQVILGVLLIVGGVLFLFDRIDLLDLTQAWRYWPLAMLVFGLNKIVPPTTSRQFVGGVWEVCLACWFYLVCEQFLGITLMNGWTFEDHWGVTMYNSWPILMIAGGACMVIEPLFKRSGAQQAEGGHEKQ